MATSAQSVPDPEIPWEQPSPESPPKTKPRRVSKKAMLKLQEQVLRENMPEILNLLADSIKHHLLNKNVEITKKSMEMARWVDGPKGININQQLNQQNNIKAGSDDQVGGPVYFESIVRKLDKRGAELAQIEAPKAEVIIEADVISEQDNSDD